MSGALVAAPNVGAQNVLQNRTTLNLGYKQDLGDRMGVALQITTPYAANTALFGRIQQSRWGGFEIRPNLYPAGALVTYRDDVMRYDLGVKHCLSAEWGISALYSQEP